MKASSAAITAAEESAGLLVPLKRLDVITL
jgi:hypothetical protein